jgi:hypothetical protein
MAHIVEKWVAIRDCRPLPLTWIPAKDWKIEAIVPEEEHSETESAEDDSHDADGRVEKEPTGNDDDDEESTSSSSDESESAMVLQLERERLTYPSPVDQLIFRVLDRYEPVQMLLNNIGRKVYIMRRITTGRLFVLTFHEDYHESLQKNGVPREIRLLQRLRGLKHVAQLEEWAFVEPDLFVTAIPFYRNFDLISTVAPSLYLISKFMQQLLIGIQGMHERKVVHRDIAKENVAWDPILEELQLLDFDCATFDRSEGFRTNVGRDDYYAPEMAQAIDHVPESTVSSYDRRVDIYAAGVLFYMLLQKTKNSPDASVLRKYLKRARKHKYHKRFPHVNLLEHMLRFDRNDRISLKDALAHPFITNTPRDDIHILMRSEMDEAMKGVDLQGVESMESSSSSA